MPRIAPLIFVSSTRADLAEYRLAVQRSFPALDVLYRGMEFFGARPSAAHEIVIQELLECDLYLGILAHRYGSTDPDSGLSFTQLEYQNAVEAGIPTMLFLIDPKQPMQQESIESDEDRRKLARFKAEVSKRIVPEIFTTPEDLVGKVSRSLQRWVDERKKHWEQSLHVPLTDWENDNIRKLYSTNTFDVIHAVQHLKRVDCRAAHEHFYSLLQRPNLDLQVAESIFVQLTLSQDDTRYSQIIQNVIADVPRLRPLAINTIGERATLSNRLITDAEIEGVLALARDPEIEVRYEVAHALGKIGAHYPAHYRRCHDCLEILKNDEVVKVKEKAVISDQRVPPRARSASR
jgi:hypothetical protein